MNTPGERCEAKTKSGKQCKRNRVDGSKYCHQHQLQKSGVENKQKTKTLYDRLGGIFAIAAVVQKFSYRVLEHPLVGKNSPNPQLRKWSREHTEDRLPGLIFMRTLWVASISGGPYKYVATRSSDDHPPRGNSSPNYNLAAAHKDLKISSSEFDIVASILSNTLDYFKVPKKEKDEVLGAFMAHKTEVVGN